MAVFARRVVETGRTESEGGFYFAIMVGVTETYDASEFFNARLETKTEAHAASVCVQHESLM